jgi:hypothetical protein
MDVSDDTREAGSPPGAFGRVQVRLVAGDELDGVVTTFNPQGSSFHLRGKSSDGSAWTRALSFEQVKSVTFFCAPGSQGARDFLPAASMVSVRLTDGEVLHGVRERFAGTHHGIFLVPVDQTGVLRIFVPASAVLEVVSTKRLGEILAEEGMITREKVEEAFRRQTELRAQKLGEILIDQRAITDQQLRSGLSLQEQGRPQRIGEILLEQGFINTFELEEALARQEQQRGRRVGEIMVEMGLTTFKMIGIALAMQYDVPFYDLSRHQPDPAVLGRIPEELVRQWGVLPLGLDDGVLTVATADPTRIKVKETLRLVTGLPVAWAIATPQDVQRTIERSFGSG